MKPRNTREEIHHGGCLCGEVRYEAVGAGYNVSHCHCVDCRRSRGAVRDVGLVSSGGLHFHEG